MSGVGIAIREANSVRTLVNPASAVQEQFLYLISDNESTVAPRETRGQQSPLI
jgi:hypothetical protein